MSVQQPALRVTLMLDETRKNRLVSVQRIRKTISQPRWPASSGDARYSGFWVELRDGGGQVVYRRIMDDPTLRREGPPPEEPDHAPHAHDAPDIPRPGLVSFVVPELPVASKIVLMASRPADAPAVPIAEFDLPQEA